MYQEGAIGVGVKIRLPGRIASLREMSSGAQNCEMDKSPADDGNDKGKSRSSPTASAVLESGAIIELVYDPERRKTHLARYDAGRWTLQNQINLEGGVQI